MKRFLSMLAGGLLTVGIAASSADAQVKYTGINIVNGAGSAIFSAATSGSETVNIPNVAGTIYMGLFNGTPFNAGVALFTAGDLVIANGAGNGVTRLAAGSNGNLLTIAGGVPAYTTATYPATTTANQLLYSSATNVVGGLASGNSSVLVTDGSGVPSLSTTLPTGLTVNNATIGGTTSISTSGNIATTGAGTITSAASVISPSFTNGGAINIAPTVSSTIGYTVGVAGGAAGAGAPGNNNGGALNLNGGAKNGSGLDGVVSINSTTTGATNIGNATGGTTITGAVSSTGNTTLATTAGTTNTFGNGGGTTTNTIGGNAIAGTTNNNLGVTTNAAGTTVNNIGGGPGTSTINIGAGGGTVTTNLGGTVNFTNAPSLPLANTQIFVGSVLNKAAAVAMSQDATIANDGKVTVVSANGAFTSAGNSTLGTSNTALANSFGTGANANSVINTIGSTGTGSLTNIYGSVANSAHNNIGSDNQGVTASNAINWKSSGIGYPVTITNEGNAASNDGLEVKVWRNNADVNALDVSYNNAVTQGTSLFTVRGDGSINGTNWSVNNAGAITATGFNSTGASTIATGASLTNSFGNGGNTTTNNIGGNGAAGTTTTNNIGVTAGTGITVNNIGTGAGTSTTNIGGTAVFTNIPTVPGGTLLTSATGVKFDVTGTQTSTTAANNLFDVTSAPATGNALGAKITSTGNGAAGNNATGLTIASTSNATGTSTALSLAATGSTAGKIAINVGTVDRIIANGSTSILNIKGTANAAFGSAAGAAVTTGNNNTAIGAGSLALNSAGNFNTAVGSGSLPSLTNGNDNTVLGYSTMSANVSGSDNTSIGFGALNNATSSNNTAVGSSALNGTQGGGDNTAVGAGALITNSSGTFNTAIGSGANVSVNNLTNATAIGAGASVAASNTIQLGDGNVTEVMTKGKLTSGVSGTAGSIKLWDAGTKFATINIANQAANTNVYSVPDVNSNANFVMSTGTGSAIFTGPTVQRTYTLPDANATLLTSTNAVSYATGVPNNSLTAPGTKLFDVSYGTVATDGAVAGASINATANATPGAGNTDNATALTLTAVAHSDAGGSGSTARGILINAAADAGNTTASAYAVDAQTGDIRLQVGNLVMANSTNQSIAQGTAAAGAGKTLTVQSGTAQQLATAGNAFAGGTLALKAGNSNDDGTDPITTSSIDFWTAKGGATGGGGQIVTKNMSLNGANLSIPNGTVTVGNPGVTTGSVVLGHAGGGNTTITPASGTHSLTLPGVDGQFMIYGPSATQATQAANGTAYLFNVAYGGASTGDALGGKIDATTATVNANATALQLTATPNGSGQATGLAVTITPGAGVNAAATFMGGNVGVGNTAPNVGVDISSDLATHMSTYTPGGASISDANFNNSSWVEIGTFASNFSIDGIGIQGNGLPSGVDGKMLNLYNNSGKNMTLIDASNSAQPVSHQVLTRTGKDVVVPNGGTIRIQYESGLQKWLVLDDIKSLSTATPTTTGGSASVSVVTMGANSNSIAGKVTFTTTAAATGDFAAVNFKATYVNPVVIITPANAVTAAAVRAADFYAVPSTGNFHITFGTTAPGNGTYSFFYQVIDTK